MLSGRIWGKGPKVEEISLGTGMAMKVICQQTRVAVYWS